jgi:hypothetical protein
MSVARIPVRLVFADRGSFHEVVVDLPADVLGHYDRIIDALREDPLITAELFIDQRRLVAAHRADSEAADSEAAGSETAGSETAGSEASPTPGA